MSKRDPQRVEFARQQRRHANEFARDVWQLVRDRQIGGVKFRREHPVGPYTLDFVCLELKLDLEVDGKGHWSDAGRQHDAERDAYLHRLGFEILRINGFRVTQDAAGVRREIEQAVEKRRQNLSSLSPSPPAPLPAEPGRGESEADG